MPTPLPQVLDPERAIWDRDAQALARALQEGWSLPQARSKEGGGVEDLSLVIRVVSLRWVEGWQILAGHFPALRSSPVLWALALRRAVPGIVSDLLEHGQGAARPLDSGLSPLHVLAESMGPLPGDPIPEADLVATAQILVAAGANPTHPHPGEFQAGDNAPFGHTLWTRAVYFGRWEMVEAFWPDSWEALSAQPRGVEMLADMRRTTLSGRMDATAARMWARAMARWIEPWLALRQEEWFALPADLDALASLPRPAREVVWRRWARADDTGWTGLHEMALSGRSRQAHRALRLAVADGAVCLDAWLAPDQAGDRPFDLWEIANRRTPDHAAMTPASQVPEVLDQDDASGA